MDSAYAQLAKTLRARLGDGEWKIGDRFPTISKIQDEYDIRSLNTVRRAQALLVGEGLLQPQQGRGTFVVGLPTPPGVDPVASALKAIDVAMGALNRARTALVGEASHHG